MTPHSLAMNLENTADTLALELWYKFIDSTALKGRKAWMHEWLTESPDTRKAIRRTMATLQMILDGDIRSPQGMAAEAEGRASE